MTVWLEIQATLKSYSFNSVESTWYYGELQNEPGQSQPEASYDINYNGVQIGNVNVLVAGSPFQLPATDATWGGKWVSPNVSDVLTSEDTAEYGLVNTQTNSETDYYFDGAIVASGDRAN